MQNNNALIGVAEAAYFPDVSLSAMVQFIGPIPLPFSAARSIQQIGATATQTLFNGGLTGAQVDAARTTYFQSVANYRQTVLTAFQQVEDELAAIRIYTKQLAIDQQAVKNAREAVRVFTNQYRSGIVDLTTVVTAETNLLSQEETELAVRQNLFLASVSLIEAVGGGWDTTLLPTQVQLMKGFSQLPKLESTPPRSKPCRPIPRRAIRKAHRESRSNGPPPSARISPRPDAFHPKRLIQRWNSRPSRPGTRSVDTTHRIAPHAVDRTLGRISEFY